MTLSAIGSRYAKALAELILKPGSSIRPEEAVQQLKTVESLIDGSPDLKSVLLTPAVQPSHKKAVLNKLASEAGVGVLIRNFVSVVIGHKRIGQLSQIRAALETTLDEEMGYVRAQVTSAAPLDEAQTKTIEAQLTKLSGKHVRMQTAVDPELLGGVVARIGSTVYDGSLRGQLENMRRKLTSESAA